MPSRVIIHVDLDAFFAAVEQRDDPHLKGKPVIVGADPKGGKGRGVVSTCSYEARRYGIHSAMPISLAYQRCPQGIFLRGRYAVYSAVAAEVREILEGFTPQIEPVSIDEAFLDVSETYHLFGAPRDVALRIKADIWQRVRLTVSVGLAPTKIVAKIASDFCKPDGLLEIQPPQLLPFLWSLPVEHLWGVGPKTRQALLQLGVVTVADLAHAPLGLLEEHFGDHGSQLHALAHGIDLREVVTDDEVKSVGHEHTFERDTDQRDEIYRVLLSLSQKVSRRLRIKGLKGRTITVKIRLKGFRTFTRALTLSERTNHVDAIYKNARRIFEDFYQLSMSIRLVGIRLTEFEDAYVQESLFVNPRGSRQEKIHQAIDTIKDRFGERTIHWGP